MAFLSGFPGLDISTAHMWKQTPADREKYGENGVFAALCQPDSLHRAITTGAPPPGPVIQVGHWVACRKPWPHGVMFWNPMAGMSRLDLYNHLTFERNHGGKYVMFTSLMEGSTARIVEALDVSDLNYKDFTTMLGYRSTAVVSDMLTLTESVLLKYLPETENRKWQAVPEAQWLPARRFVFRMKPSDLPAALVIHKAVPKYQDRSVERFMQGYPDAWAGLKLPSFAINADWSKVIVQTDYFLPPCPLEENRAPVDLDDCCIQALLGCKAPHEPAQEPVVEGLPNPPVAAPADLEPPDTPKVAPVADDMDVDMGPAAPAAAPARPPQVAPTGPPTAAPTKPKRARKATKAPKPAVTQVAVPAAEGASPTPAAGAEAPVAAAVGAAVAPPATLAGILKRLELIPMHG